MKDFTGLLPCPRPRMNRVCSRHAEEVLQGSPLAEHAFHDITLNRLGNGVSQGLGE